jgi:EAL domain-containing protein (putative c-di-GMP-specific phosphodiesterase class I)
LLRQASLSVFRMPQLEGALSCALSLGAPQKLAGVERDADGLLPAASFERTAANLIEEAEQAGLPLRLDLIELKGLGKAVEAMDGQERERTRREVAATLRAQSLGGVGAAEVAEDRFALVSRGGGLEALSTRLTAITGDQVSCRTAALPLEAGAPAQNLRAMRYALDRYIEDGPSDVAPGFLARVKQTVQETARFRTMLNARGFQLAYQPVTALDTGAVHHFEALARFEADASTGDTIRLAEELGLIAEFDRSVLALVADTLRESDSKVRIAANVSAGTLMQPGFVDVLTDIVRDDRGLRTRLLIEVTETKKISDLPQAGRIIKALRAKGHSVCIDDFGVGAASMDYLRQLEVDIVKLDGSLVKGVAGASRDMLIARHIIALCRELKIRTIAEMIEAKAVADLMHAAGADFGQGWYFGKPTPKPQLLAAAGARVVKRAGMVEHWG